jgi:3-polyprenyl-4-hydroxybenzoate decarboxylase
LVSGQTVEVRARGIRREMVLRQYLGVLRKLGELREVNVEVDRDLEIGAIAQQLYETGGPAALFNRSRGLEPGVWVLADPAGVSRQPGLYLCRFALSLGLEPTATGAEIVNRLADALSPPPIPPRTVANGPCNQNVLTGAAANLRRLPAPLVHSGDRGRYIGTYGTVVVARSSCMHRRRSSATRRRGASSESVTRLALDSERLGRCSPTCTACGRSTIESGPCMSMCWGLPSRSNLNR